MNVIIDLQKIKNENVRRRPVMNWSDVSAKKGRQIIAIRPGLNLHIENIKHPIQSYQFEIKQSPLEFGVLLSGQTRCHIKASTNKKEVLYANAGTNTITCLPGSQGILEQAEAPLVSVGLQVAPEFIYRYLSDESERLPSTFMDIVHGSLQTSFTFFQRDNDRLQEVARQVLACPVSGVANRILLEGKSMEFLAYHLEQLMPVPQMSATGLSRKERDQIHMARDLLIESCQYPPSLLDLARSVRLTHTRLNQGFRITFGKTVFEYLRSYRLRKAKSLLLDHSISITEIAHQCGFSDASHFTKSFYKFFGFLPSTYRKMQ